MGTSGTANRIASQLNNLVAIETSNLNANSESVITRMNINYYDYICYSTICEALAGNIKLANKEVNALIDLSRQIHLTRVKEASADYTYIGGMQYGINCLITQNKEDHRIDHPSSIVALLCQADDGLRHALCVTLDHIRYTSQSDNTWVRVTQEYHKIASCIRIDNNHSCHNVYTQTPISSDIYVRMIVDLITIIFMCGPDEDERVITAQLITSAIIAMQVTNMLANEQCYDLLSKYTKVIIEQMEVLNKHKYDSSNGELNTQITLRTLCKLVFSAHKTDSYETIAVHCDIGHLIDSYRMGKSITPDSRNDVAYASILLALHHYTNRLAMRGALIPAQLLIDADINLEVRLRKALDTIDTSKECLLLGCGSIQHNKVRMLTSKWSHVTLACTANTDQHLTEKFFSDKGILFSNSVLVKKRGPIIIIVIIGLLVATIPIWIETTTIGSAIATRNIDVTGIMSIAIAAYVGIAILIQNTWIKEWTWYDMLRGQIRVGNLQDHEILRTGASHLIRKEIGNGSGLIKRSISKIGTCFQLIDSMGETELDIMFDMIELWTHDKMVIYEVIGDKMYMSNYYMLIDSVGHIAINKDWREIVDAAPDLNATKTTLRLTGEAEPIVSGRVIGGDQKNTNENIVLKFIQEHIRFCKGASILVSDVYDIFRDWVKSSYPGKRIPDINSFSQELRNANIHSERT